MRIVLIQDSALFIQSLYTVPGSGLYAPWPVTDVQVLQANIRQPRLFSQFLLQQAGREPTSDISTQLATKLVVATSLVATEDEDAAFVNRGEFFRHLLLMAHGLHSSKTLDKLLNLANQHGGDYEQMYLDAVILQSAIEDIDIISNARYDKGYDLLSLHQVIQKAESEQHQVTDFVALGDDSLMSLMRPFQLPIQHIEMKEALDASSFEALSKAVHCELHDPFEPEVTLAQQKRLEEAVAPLAKVVQDFQQTIMSHPAFFVSDTNKDNLQHAKYCDKATVEARLQQEGDFVLWLDHSGLAYCSRYKEGYVLHRKLILEDNKHIRLSGDTASFATLDALLKHHHASLGLNQFATSKRSNKSIISHEGIATKFAKHYVAPGEFILHRTIYGQLVCAFINQDKAIEHFTITEHTNGYQRYGSDEVFVDLSTLVAAQHDLKRPIYNPLYSHISWSHDAFIKLLPKDDIMPLLEMFVTVWQNIKQDKCHAYAFLYQDERRCRAKVFDIRAKTWDDIACDLGQGGITLGTPPRCVVADNLADLEKALVKSTPLLMSMIENHRTQVTLYLQQQGELDTLSQLERLWQEDAALLDSKHEKMELTSLTAVQLKIQSAYGELRIVQALSAQQPSSRLKRWFSAKPKALESAETLQQAVNAFIEDPQHAFDALLKTCLEVRQGLATADCQVSWLLHKICSSIEADLVLFRDAAASTAAEEE